MSDWTYTYRVNQDPGPSKPLRWIHGEVKTPPFTKDARLEAGFLLRRLQDGESLGMPHSRRCRRSVPGATKVGSLTRAPVGASSIESMSTPS